MPGVLYYNGDILTMEPQLYAPAIWWRAGAFVPLALSSSWRRPSAPELRRLIYRGGR